MPGSKHFVFRCLRGVVPGKYVISKDLLLNLGKEKTYGAERQASGGLAHCLVVYIQYSELSVHNVPSGSH